jgi:hypothetical protein
MKSDYLKYWRVVRYYVKAKYNLSQADLDILLFLYSESYFSRDKFAEFDSLLSWNETRFDKLLKDGWVVTFRERKGNRRALYELSFKCKRMIDSIYKKLNGEEISESDNGTNPIFAKNVKYTDRRYKNMIVSMNKEIREKKRT